MHDRYSQRITRAQGIVENQGLGGLIIGTGSELAYFTGSWMSSHERLTCLVITHDRAVMVAPATDVAELDFDLDVETRSYVDGDDPYSIVAAVLGKGPVGLGSSLTAPHVLALQKRLDGPTELLPPSLSQVKEDYELQELRRAAHAIDAVHARVPDLLRAGRTEREVAEELRELILEEHEEVDFIIVGSGPNGANPHHSFSDRVLSAGEPVVVDLGGRVDSGYRSDCTRTYVVPGAEPPAEFTEAYAVVRAAFDTGVQAAVVGSTAQDVDAATRTVIADAGLGEYFTHRTGHGIGLTTHEEPYLLKGNTTPVQTNMAFSVEPGVYLPGKWGIRIEDIVAVSEEGSAAEHLNRCPIAEH